MSSCPDPTLTGNDSAVFTNGIVFYNDIKMNMTTRAQAQVTAVYSDSGRQLKYLRHVVRIDAIISADDCNTGTDTREAGSYRYVHEETTGGWMADLRERLMQPGKRLFLRCLGLGYDIDIPAAVAGTPITPNVVSANIMKGGTSSMTNDRTMQRVDVLYGPRPQLLTWEPIGTARAARIEWTVEFHLARCYDEKTDIAAVEWDSSWSINEAGLTVRSTSGYIEVANRLLNIDAGDRKAANHADRYREWITTWFPTLTGYHRTQQYTQSADRSRLDFFITDTEIDSGENAYYPGVIRADVTRSVRNQGIAGPTATATKWSMSLSGSIEVKPGLSKRVAWAAFITIVREQLAYFESESEVVEGVEKDEEKESRKRAKFTVLTGLSIDEELFGRSVSFSISWVFTTTLSALIESTGLFTPLDTKAKKPLPGAREPEKIHDWRRWSAEMAREQSPRGVAGIMWNRDSDMVVDFCRGDAMLDAYVSPTGRIETASRPILRREDPDPEYSYLDYKCSLEASEDTSTVIQKTVREPSFEPKEFDGDHTSFRQSKGEIEFAPSGYLDSEGEQSVVTHRRGDSSYEILIRGYCIRAGRTAPEPVLKSWRGIPVTLINRKVTVEGVGRTDSSLFLTQWAKRYVLEGALQGDIGKTGSRDTQQPQLIGQGLAEGIV